MTEKENEKDVKEAAPAEEEVVELTQEVLEQLLVGCYWDILKRMREVAIKELTADQAADLDDALARHLARTLMNENPHLAMRLPYHGLALIEMFKASEPERFTQDALTGVEQSNPCAMMIFIGREFVRECYFAITAAGSRDDCTAETIRDAGAALCALWCRRLTQPGAEKGLN